jgi:hypothetical protein
VGGLWSSSNSLGNVAPLVGGDYPPLRVLVPDTSVAAFVVATMGLLGCWNAQE